MNSLEGNEARGTEALFRVIAGICLAFPLVLLALLIGQVVLTGATRLSWDFITGMPSRLASSAGMLPAIAGSLYLMILTAIVAIPIGIAAAIYLEEFAPRNKLTWIIEVNVSNLAGVPSIIYGLLGLEVFVRSLAFGRSLLAGACTLSLLLLPILIMTTREALRTVPLSYREAAWALGGDRWKSIRVAILPMCLPSILTGVILALARAIGETAPLVAIGAVAYVAFVPDSLFSQFTAMPLQIFNWVSRPQEAFHVNAAAAILVLMTTMLLLSGVAIYLRARTERRISG